MKEKFVNFFSKENLKKVATKGFWVAFFESFIWLGILLFVIDIISKQLVKNLMEVGDYIELIPNFLAIHYVQNKGMAFGLNFNDTLTNTIVFCLISIVGFIILSVLYVKYYKKSTKLVRASLMLMITGCFGNLIDRCFYVLEDGTHYVVDFIGFFGRDGFARFNVADSCLVIGCIMLAIYFIVEEFKETKKARKVEIGETQTGKFEENAPIETSLNEDALVENSENEKGPATIANSKDSTQDEKEENNSPDGK